MKNSALAPGGVINLTCGAAKRKREDHDMEITRPKRQARPIISMILHADGNRHQIRTLLDTGCSIPLIN